MPLYEQHIESRARLRRVRVVPLYEQHIESRARSRRVRVSRTSSLLRRCACAVNNQLIPVSLAVARRLVLAVPWALPPASVVSTTTGNLYASIISNALHVLLFFSTSGCATKCIHACDVSS